MKVNRWSFIYAVCFLLAAVLTLGAIVGFGHILYLIVLEMVDPEAQDVAGRVGASAAFTLLTGIGAAVFGGFTIDAEEKKSMVLWE